MDSPYNPLEFALLNTWQRDFPLESRPFATIAQEVGMVGGPAGTSETAVIETLQRLVERGAVSRVGAVFAPRRVGASTLAALAAPAERLEQVAARVSARPEINHNYQREHRFNLWFVATASDQRRLAATLDAIAAETGCPVMALPLLEEFHIDLGFDLNAGGAKRHPCLAPEAPRYTPSDEEARLMAALQSGLELTARPFERLARRAATSEARAVGQLRAWLAAGLIKRFGVVVRHYELGYKANAMVVFDVPDAEVSGTGARLAREAGVTLCYRRERHMPEWPYNLYCMVHGRSREEVAPVIERLGAVAGHPCAALFSLRRFKQCGARYFPDGDGARD